MKKKRSTHSRGDGNRSGALRRATLRAPRGRGREGARAGDVRSRRAFGRYARVRDDAVRRDRPRRVASLQLRRARPAAVHAPWLRLLGTFSRSGEARATSGTLYACVRPVLFDRRAGARAGTIRGGKSPRAARPRGDLCACLVRRDRVRACEKSPGGARFADTSSPNCYTISPLRSRKRRWRACPPLACGAHTDARARTPRVSRETSRLARALRRDSHRTHDRHADKTMRPPAGRGFGGGGRGFGGRGSPGGRGFGGRGGRGGRGGFDEGPPDTVVGACHSFSFAFLARISTGRRTRRAMPRSFPPVEIVGLP